MFVLIWFYSGTPGSGKSLHVAKDIYHKLRKGGSVIASFAVNMPCDYSGTFTEVDLLALKPDFFVDYAREHHVYGKESQTLIVLDECQIIFNPREFGRSDRLDWIKFFSQHRKLGYNVILISQFDRLVDRQIRSLFEYEVKHRKVNNYGAGAFVPVATFACVTYWYGVREKISVDFFTYRKKYGCLYDTYLFFSPNNNLYHSDAQRPLGDGEQGAPVEEGGLTQLIDDNYSSEELETLSADFDNVNKISPLSRLIAWVSALKGMSRGA